MDYSLNGLALTEAEVTLPAHGVWVADVFTADSDSSVTVGAAATLLFGELTLLGTVMRGGESFGSNRVRIQGGKGGMGLLATPQGWNNATYAQIAKTTLAGQREALSATVTVATVPALFATTQFWTVRAEPVGLALSRIVDAAGLQWRVLPDGTVWVGAETWPVADIGSTAITLIEFGVMPEQGREWFGVDSPILLPGTTFEGRRVSDVLYRLHRNGDSQTLRMNLLYED